MIETPVNIANLCQELLVELVSHDNTCGGAEALEYGILEQIAVAMGHLLVEHDMLMKRCQRLSIEKQTLEDKVAYLQNYINMREEPVMPCKKQRSDH